MISIINRLVFYFIINLEVNEIQDEGRKVLAEALRLNKNLTKLELRKLLLLFTQINTIY